MDYLNEVLTMDREFLSALVQMRVKCGAEIAMHPTLQVINLNQMDDVLAPPPIPPPEPEAQSGAPAGWVNPFPTLPPTNPVKDLDDLPQPRWVAGVLGLINGFIGVSEHGKGPVDAEVNLETKLIERFVVSDPYKKRTD